MAPERIIAPQRLWRQQNAVRDPYRQNGHPPDWPPKARKSYDFQSQPTQDNGDDWQEELARWMIQQTGSSNLIIANTVLLGRAKLNGKVAK